MRYFDAGRPGHDNRTPKLMWSHGEGWAISTLYIEPEPPDGTEAPSWRVTVMVRTSARGASNRSIVVEDLNAFGERWLASPEEVLRTEFGYDGHFEDEGGEATKAALELSDLL